MALLVWHLDRIGDDTQRLVIFFYPRGTEAGLEFFTGYVVLSVMLKAEDKEIEPENWVILRRLASEEVAIWFLGLSTTKFSRLSATKNPDSQG